MIEQVAGGDQRAVAVAEQEERSARGLLLHPGEEDVQVGEVLVEPVHVGALAAALAMSAAVGQMDRVSGGGQGARDLGVAAEVLGVSVHERDVAGGRGGALGVPEESDAVAGAEETFLDALFRHAAASL